MKIKTKVRKAVYNTVLAMVLLAVLVFAVTPTQTYLSDTTSYFKGVVGIGTDSPTGELEIENAGTGNGQFIDQNGNGIALSIDSEATTSSNNGLLITTGQGAKPFKARTDEQLRFEVQADGERAGYLYRNQASAETTTEVVGIVQDNAGDDQDALSIQNDGTGNGQYIDQNGDGIGLNIDSEATSAASFPINIVADQGAGLFRAYTTTNNKIQYNAQNSGVAMAQFYRSFASTITDAPVVFIEQDNAGDDQDALSIQNDGTGSGLYIYQTGANKALSLEGTATTGGLMQVYTNSAHTGTGYSTLATIRVNNPASTGDGLYIDQNGNGVALNIDSEATTEKVINIQAINTEDSVVAIDNLGIQTIGQVLRILQNNPASTSYASEMRNDGIAPVLNIVDGGCAVGQYGLYESANDLYWCKNGVSTQLN